MNTSLQTLTNKLAARLEMGDARGDDLIETLKATAFKGQVSDAQMTALMVVANQFSLNPWTREIYAFPDKNNGIVPIVGVDGWSRIINSHPQFDGMDFTVDETVGGESCTCRIYRKDRAHPVSVTEYLSECKRGTQPWQSHPRRMLRHKAMIQCARIAFGYGGIFDQDEAETFSDGEKFCGTIDAATGEILPPSGRVDIIRPPYSDAQMEKNMGAWQRLVETGTSPESIIAKIRSRNSLTHEQEEAILALGNKPESAPLSAESQSFVDEMEGA